MAAPSIPPVLAIAKIKTPTKAAKTRYFDIFPPLVAHSKDNEPDTLSYYFFTGAFASDNTVYGFKAYPTTAALVDIHAQSDVYKKQSAIIEDEQLCTVDVDQFKPLGGFILRSGQVEQPAGLIIINKYHTSAGEKPNLASNIQEFAHWVETEEMKGCDTFVVMENLQTGGIWTFERYKTPAYYKEEHLTSMKFRELVGNASSTPVTDDYVESGVGFLWKEVG